MDLVALLDAAEDGDRVLDRRLADEDRLEPPLEGGVLLDVLAVLVERGGADAAQLAAGQGRLEQVGGVHRPLGLARADDQVQLVDEQDDPALGLGDVLEDGLEPLFELAAELGAGDQGAHVQRDRACGSGGSRARRPRRSAGPGPRRSPSCPRRARRSGPGCSWSGGESTWTTRRISESRPMTGSILPLRASSTRSRPYRSSAWYLSSGFGSVTVWPPRTFWSARRISFSLMPRASSSCWAWLLTFTRPSRRCSTETYWSFIRSASAWAVSRTDGQVGAEGLLAAGDLGQGVQALLGGLRDLGGIDAELVQERPDDLLLGVEQGRPAGAWARAAGARGRAQRPGPPARPPGS